MAREYPVRPPVQSPPVHPGEILREDGLPALRLSMTVAAKTPRNDWRIVDWKLVAVRGIEPRFDG